MSVDEAACSHSDPGQLPMKPPGPARHQSHHRPTQDKALRPVHVSCVSIGHNSEGLHMLTTAEAFTAQVKGDRLVSPSHRAVGRPVGADLTHCLPARFASWHGAASTRTKGQRFGNICPRTSDFEPHTPALGPPIHPGKVTTGPQGCDLSSLINMRRSGLHPGSQSILLDVGPGPVSGCDV